MKSIEHDLLMRTSTRDVRMYKKQKNGKLGMLSPMSMEHEILGDTDLETIIKDFECKKCDAMKYLVVDFLQKALIDRATETRVTSISSFLSILRNLNTFAITG